MNEFLFCEFCSVYGMGGGALGECRMGTFSEGSEELRPRGHHPEVVLGGYSAARGYWELLIQCSEELDVKREKAWNKEPKPSTDY